MIPLPLYGSIQITDPDPLLPQQRDKGASINVHDDVHSSFKSAIFGFSDGLTTNINLILGVYCAISHHAAPEVARTVVLLGITGLFAGASSMACGEYLSSKAEEDSHRRELEIERRHLETIPQIERDHMKGLLKSRGLQDTTVEAVLNDVAALDLDRQVEFHARYELGIDPDDLHASASNALWMWLFFTFGALIPLVPWLICTDITWAFNASICGSVMGFVLISMYQVKGCWASFPRTLLRTLVLSAISVSLTVGANILITRRV